jgi:IS5 family transposase
MQDKCTNHFTGMRSITIGPWEKEIFEAERHNETKLYREEMRLRALIEVTNSDMKRNHGMRRARYRGILKVGLQFFFTAAAINIKRWISNILEKVKPKNASTVAAICG